MGKLKFSGITQESTRTADEGPRYMVERVYTDDGDATDDFMVYDTKNKTERFHGPSDKAKAICDYLNGRRSDRYI